jgi:hypothetical protein
MSGDVLAVVASVGMLVGGALYVTLLWRRAPDRS